MSSSKCIRAGWFTFLACIYCFTSACQNPRHQPPPWEDPKWQAQQPRYTELAEDPITPEWVLTWGDSGRFTSSSLSNDRDGNIYLAGYFDGWADFNPGPGTEEHEAGEYFDAYIISLTPSGEYRWGYTWGGPNYDYANWVETDNDGNVFVTGRFFGSIDLDTGEGVTEHGSGGVYNAFLYKFDNEGDCQWISVWEADDAYTAAIAENGNLYVTGDFSGSRESVGDEFRDVTMGYQPSVDFDPGPGEEIHRSNGQNDAYLAAFDNSGEFLWVQCWGGPGSDFGCDVELGPDGDIYVSGGFRETVDFNPGKEIEEYTSNGETDCFLSKFTSTGEFQWARAWGGTDYEEGFPIEIDGDGNVYLIGTSSSGADLDPGPATVQGPDDRIEDLFLSVFNSEGELQNTTIWGSPGGDMACSLGLDTEDNAYIAGNGQYWVKPEPGWDNYSARGGSINVPTLCKIDSQGEIQWNAIWAAIGDGFCTAVKADESGNIYAAGNFSGTTDFDLSDGTMEVTPNGQSWPCFLVRIPPDAGDE